MTTAVPQPRGPLFWILIIGGVVMTGCCLMTGLFTTLGVLASEPEPPASTGNTGTASSKFLIANEISRGNSLTIPLSGGRWMAQFGSIVENVVGRAGDYRWVQTNTSGSLYELTFGDDSYEWHTAAQVTMYGNQSQSHCVEKGSWELSGTQLTFKPEVQKCVYSSGGQDQEKEDEELGARTYEVFDLTLETVNEPKQQLPGVFMSGPRPKWDTGYGEVLQLKLQQLD